MRATRRVALAVFCGLAVWAGALPVRAQLPPSNAADALFNNQVLQEIRLLVNSRDLSLLRASFQTNLFVPADLVWNNQRVRSVAIRSRGQGSRNPSKMGLLVDMDRYTRGQTFLGLTELVLDNEWQDPSLMHEMLSFAVYRRVGQIAPREAFAKVYINNEFQGVYAVVEPINEPFLQRVFGSAAGYLSEYHWIRTWYFETIGDDLNLYKPMFEPRTHTLESDTQLYGPIRDLVNEVNGPDDVVWRDRVGARLDLAQFMQYAALQGCLTQNDGLVGFAGMNNFYLYRPNGSTQFRFLPWDEDFAFTFLEAPIARHTIPDNVLFPRAYAQEDLKGVFLDAAQNCADAMSNDWMLNEVNRLTALIGSAVFSDTKKLYSNDQFLAEVDFLRQFAVARPLTVASEVARLR